MEPRGIAVSFVIPTYNAALHIERCLRSIRSQRYPQESVEILVIDGGSSDATVDIAMKQGCRILKNKDKLAEYGVQIGVQSASGEFLVIFAADNELVADTWINEMTGVFNADTDISAAWGRLASGRDDSSLNKYFALIQSDPLNWFLNKNLNSYKSKAPAVKDGVFVFRVDPKKPLVWGANGLAYRSERIKKIWSQSGYLGDNDAFQYMIEQGNNTVAYFDYPFVYHHHVARMRDWIKKWRRNFTQHLIDKQKTRNMNWVFTGNFKMKLFLWVFYSAIPVFSLLDSIYLSFKDKNIYWLYHPIVSFAQFFTYTTLIFFSRDGRNFMKNILTG